MIYQLTRGATPKMLAAAGLGGTYTEHGVGIYPGDANGVPFTTAYLQCTGDPIADLTEDMAAEQKARVVYEHLINLTDDVCVIRPLQFLREREIVHYQRFGECLDIVQNCKFKRSCDDLLAETRQYNNHGAGCSSGCDGGCNVNIY